MDEADLTGLFKQHFTFAIALTAAQRCVSTSPDAVVSYILAAAGIIVILKVATPVRSSTNPFWMLADQSAKVTTQVLSSLLGTWLTSMVGETASTDTLLAAAVLGLTMVWIASRSLSILN